MMCNIRVFRIPNGKGWWRAVGRINGKEFMEDYYRKPSMETARADLMTRYRPYSAYF